MASKISNPQSLTHTAVSRDSLVVCIWSVCAAWLHTPDTDNSKLFSMVIPEWFPRCWTSTVRHTDVIVYLVCLPKNTLRKFVENWWWLTSKIASSSTIYGIDKTVTNKNTWSCYNRYLMGQSNCWSTVEMTISLPKLTFEPGVPACNNRNPT